MRESVTVLVEGEVVAADRALPATDRGFLLGDAAFEVLRVYDGRAFRLDAHLARLEASANALGFVDVPACEVLAEDVSRALSQSGLRDAYVRIVITRGDGLGLSPAPSPCRRVVIVAPLVLPPSETYTGGVSALVVSSPFDAGAHRGGGSKTASYIEHVLAAREARSLGAEEAIFMAPSGQILEGAASNVLAVIDGVLLTPRLSTGILPGVTRSVVLGLAAEHEIAFEEGLITLVSLRRASEILLTSSIRELVPVTTLDRRPVGGGVPGPVFLTLRALYEAEAAAQRRDFD